MRRLIPKENEMIRKMTAAVPQHGTRDDRIRLAQNAVIARMTAIPDAARSTILTSGRVDDGLICRVEQGRFSAVLDLGPGMGGDAAGPSPGFFARAAIAGCVSIAVKMLAARSGVALDAVDVSVETDFDDAALFGLGSGKAAPLNTRIGIVVTSEAPEGRVQDIVDQALANAPWFRSLQDPQQISTHLTVNGQSRARPTHGSRPKTEGIAP